MPSSSSSLLCDLPETALWTSRTWTEFAQLPARAKHIVILPLFGFADWGLGRPLDLEEILGTAVLRAALATPGVKRLPLTLLPPLRFVLGPYPHTVFGLDYETALDVVREISAGVKAAGFRKLVFFNTSPWNEEFIDAAARDLRVASGLQTFRINLAALELDLHPVRSPNRTAVQRAACACWGTLPEAEPAREEITLRDFRPGHIRQPGPLRFDQPLATARAAGAKLLAAAGRRLGELFTEIYARRALAADGRIPVMRPPKLPRRKTRRAASR